MKMNHATDEYTHCDTLTSSTDYLSLQSSLAQPATRQLQPLSTQQLNELDLFDILNEVLSIVQE
eukprot:CAMPEP_0198122942 /NCGR_PEP_ID=MMETSP1442-20131203/36240_1 /TAXON_ID= /ORGANISM="Craspedostauros australis, Strain CCMP3328" /LENGTH=63 /DNA_ID=CAMNT_0043782055 /DNA_START=27 /DNA_END=218 /DNA_ORIENTATION=+